MSAITVLYGTESGNAEMVADDMAAALTARGMHATSQDLADVDVTSLAPGSVVLVSSTYNEGDLPASAEPFHLTLEAQRPNLNGLRFAAFGLGDSTYANYNQAIETLREALIRLGAEQIGDTGRHDAASGISPDGPALTWLESVFQTAATA